MSVSHIPEGYSAITPYLVVKGVDEALRFYADAFSAKVTMRLEHPASGAILHAEMRIGGATVMLGEDNPTMGFTSPETLGGTAGSVMIYTDDADAMFSRALSLGAEELQPMTDQFYGDRSGMLRDPFGHRWNIATHTEDLSEEEINRRFEEMMASGGGTDC